VGCTVGFGFAGAVVAAVADGAALDGAAGVVTAVGACCEPAQPAVKPARAKASRRRRGTNPVCVTVDADHARFAQKTLT